MQGAIAKYRPDAVRSAPVEPPSETDGRCRITLFVGGGLVLFQALVVVVGRGNDAAPFVLLAVEVGLLTWVALQWRRDAAVSSRRQVELAWAKGTVEQAVADRTAELSRWTDQLRASEERYRQLFDAIPHPMVVIDDATRKYLAVNDAAVRAYGYDRDEFVGMVTADVEQPGERVVSRPGGGTTVRRCRHRLKSGEVGQFEVADHPVLFDGRPARIALALDVTERAQLEDQLKQAQKLESIGQLAAGIAHEINTPIQYIGDNTTFLGDAFRDLTTALSAMSAEIPDYEFLATEIPKAIDQSLDGVRHVSGIVKALKEFAHPGTGEKTPIDLNRALRNVVTVARNEWKYSAEVVMKLDPDLPNVPALPGELNQVFLNLLVNAVHAIQAAGRDGKGVITITTRKIGGRVEILVADTGCGIPDRIRDRVFDPFFTTKPVGQGTGQGLTIAHAVVVQRHGGTITFETEAGVGTTFVVGLPLVGGVTTRSGRIPYVETHRPAPEVVA